jgi:UDP-N-acetylmuramoylalanine--D-glutamate ligase
MTGLKAYAEEGLDVENKHKKIILIAGGYDKNLDNSVMAKPIVNTCKAIVLIGQIAEKIEKAVSDVDKDFPIYRETSLEDAVNRAKSLGKEGDIVLLSPAAASFDMFKNAYHRGDCFKEIVNNL